MRHDDPRLRDETPDDDGFADELDTHIRARARRQPGASALDPSLWDRIAREARPPQRRGSRAVRSVASPATRGAVIAAEPVTRGRGPTVPPRPRSRNRTFGRTIPDSAWRRGLAALTLVVVLIGVVAATRWSEAERDGSTQMLQAPDLPTTVTFDATRCDVAPLTVAEVYAIVVDPTVQEAWETRVGVGATPRAGSASLHTETWLPAANGTVRLANEAVEVRQALPDEFQGIEASLNRYLRCQEDGTNYHLWALESPVEVQRQILTPIVSDLRVPDEEVTESMIVDAIGRLGPLPREEGQYMRFTTEGAISDSNPLDGLRLEANPSRVDVFVAGASSSAPGFHAWIGTQLVDEESGDVVMSRGAHLNDHVVVRDDGPVIAMVGVFILVQPEGSEEWLVEWFVQAV